VSPSLRDLRVRWGGRVQGKTATGVRPKDVLLALVLAFHQTAGRGGAGARGFVSGLDLRTGWRNPGLH
jgi:hypothetical protein